MNAAVASASSGKGADLPSVKFTRTGEKWLDGEECPECGKALALVFKQGKWWHVCADALGGEGLCSWYKETVAPVKEATALRELAEAIDEARRA